MVRRGTPQPRTLRMRRGPGQMSRRVWTIASSQASDCVLGSPDEHLAKSRRIAAGSGHGHRGKQLIETVEVLVHAAVHVGEHCVALLGRCEDGEPVDSAAAVLEVSEGQELHVRVLGIALELERLHDAARGADLVE